MRFADDVNSGQQNLNALQTADIDLGGIDNWKPISMYNSSDPRPFLGIYNGNGYTISHLKISNNESAAGLFGMISGDALLTGIHLRDVEISIQNKAHTVGTLVELVGVLPLFPYALLRGKSIRAILTQLSAD